jgi:radical SAM superfamily enzyme YgiQ (UPF0313 family)
VHLFPGEELLLPAPAKRAADLTVTWAFPNQYAVGMAGLGYQLIWWLLEQNAEIEVRRAFTDRKQPGWEKCHLFGFTLSWELDYLNVLSLLQEAGIPWLSRQRDDTMPLVFAGGPALSANPEPFAEFFDVILLGDAEETIPRLLKGFDEVRSMPSRESKLRHLAGIDGLYVPSLYRYVVKVPKGPIQSIEPAVPGVPERLKRFAYQPPSDYVAHSVILSKESSWGQMFLIEVVRSCPQECRFCLASYLTRPFRGANVDTLMQKVDLGLTRTRKIGLLGPSVTEHKEFEQIAQALLARPEVEVSVASIRIDTIGPTVLKMLVSLGQKSVTIALESGSERLRAIMKKNLTEPEIKRAMDLIAESGLSAVKFYGIVGLPGETQEDLDETVRLLTELKKKHKKLRFTFGVSTFVPKAQTPFQWAGRDRQAGKKVEYVRKRLSKIGIDVRPESHNWSDIQALLSRGDRRLTPVLVAAAEGGSNLGAWKRALRNLPAGCPTSDFYIYRNIPYEETLPWAHLVEDAKATILTRHSLAADALLGANG